MKSSLLQLLIVAILCVGTLVGYRVWYGVVASSSAAAAAAQDTIDARKSEIDAAASGKTALGRLVEAEEAVQGYFVPEESVPTFIGDIERLGRSLGTTVTVLSVAKSGTGNETLLTLSITVRGGFESVLRTVGSIEYAPYSLSIRSLALAQETKGTWRADVRMIVGVAPPGMTKKP